MDSAPSRCSSTLTTERGSCCLCGGAEGEVVVRGRGDAMGWAAETFTFIRCPSCKVLFLDPRPAPESLALLYPDDEYYSRDIEKLLPYVITWQVKENVRTKNGTSPTDFTKLMEIVREHHYSGYFPLETLGEGDPKKKVTKLYRKVTKLMP